MASSLVCVFDLGFLGQDVEAAVAATFGPLVAVSDDSDDRVTIREDHGPKQSVRRRISQLRRSLGRPRSVRQILSGKT